MPCFYPRQVWYSKFLTKLGKRKLAFKKEDALCGGINSFFISCRLCIGCRLEYSRQWAIRCMHEASLHESNSFITLTYNPANLPKDGSLNTKVFQDFMKRLRSRLDVNGIKIRFFMCGEYGDKYGRPHYHACIFGYDFPDKVFLKKRNGYPLFRSPLLEECWTEGYSSVGTLTFESAAYVARYVTVKAYGEKAFERYAIVNEDGTFSMKKAEYCTMSLRPGIASDWFDKFSSDVYPNDAVISQGQAQRPPKYYDNKYQAEEPSDFEMIKRKRRRIARLSDADNTAERLMVKEQCLLLKTKKLVRNVGTEIYEVS